MARKRKAKNTPKKPECPFGKMKIPKNVIIIGKYVPYYDHPYPMTGYEGDGDRDHAQIRF